MSRRPGTVVECFAGAGMFRLGLGPRWKVVFANDHSPMKAAVYAANFGHADLIVDDVANIDVDRIPGKIDLVHGSPPCVDVSLAGRCAGLSAARSGAFWPWWRLVRNLDRSGKGPALITLENVTGLLHSNHGADFSTVLAAFQEEGFAVGPLLLDAAAWLPQSRPRLLLVAVREALCRLRPQLLCPAPQPFAHPPRLLRALDRLPETVRSRLLWWSLPSPPPREIDLNDIIDRDPTDVPWHEPEATDHLLGLMSSTNRAKVTARRASEARSVGAVFRRTRPVDGGGKAQRAEVRFDIAGCLRVATGGSSRQILLVIENGRVRTRLISGREAARLMGLPESFQLPASVNDALSVAGDGIAVPMVRHVAHHLLEPLLEALHGASDHVA